MTIFRWQISEDVWERVPELLQLKQVQVPPPRSHGTPQPTGKCYPGNYHFPCITILIFWQCFGSRYGLRFLVPEPDFDIEIFGPSPIPNQQLGIFLFGQLFYYSSCFHNIILGWRLISTFIYICMWNAQENMPWLLTFCTIIFHVVFIILY